MIRVQNLPPEILEAIQGKVGISGALTGSEGRARQERASIAATPSHAAPNHTAPLFRETDDLASLNRRFVQETLARVNGNKAEAARLLGIHRRSLYRLLERLSLD